MFELIYETVFGAGIQIYLKTFTFPGGEVQVSLSRPRNYINEGKFILRAHLGNSEDIMTMLLIVNAIRNEFPDTKIVLDLRYLPYARQDRIANKGEALSIKVMCDLINSLNFYKVKVWDCHSDVGLALLNNVDHVCQDECFCFMPAYLDKNTTLVSPDAGATKKTAKIAKRYGYPLIQAHKTRNTQTGEISGVYVEPTDTLNDLLIVDDIADGGRSFLELGKALRTGKNEERKIYLYITHGIFSKGLDVFNGIIDHIYVANPFPGVDLTNPIITNIKV